MNLASACNFRALLGAVVAIALLTGGCDDRAGSRSRAGEDDSVPPLRVAGSVHALGDLVRQIGGQYVAVDSIIETGQTLSGFWPTGTARDRLSRAELIVAGTSMTEPWATTDSSNPYAPQRVVRLDTLPIATPTSPISPATPTSSPPAISESAASAPIASAPITSAPIASAPIVASSRSGGAEAGLLWLDPLVVQAATDALADRLTSMRPKREAYFRQQAAAVKAQVGELFERSASRFSQLPRSRRRVMALSGEFDPLARRFGIEVIHIVDEPPQRLSEDQVRMLRDAARELATPQSSARSPARRADQSSAPSAPPMCLLVRSDTPTGLLQDLALRTGMRMVPLDPYGSSNNPDRDSIVELLKYDIDQLADALNVAE